MAFKMWLVSGLAVIALAATSCLGPQAAAQQITQSGAAAEIENLVESIYTEVNFSIVNIEVLLPSSGISIFPPGHPNVSPTPGGAPLDSALGSGIVFDSSGDILTNNHVVDGATRITVTFHDGTTVDATLVGADPDSDLAVVKVNVPASQLHPITIADSSQLKVGQLAIAIGNPFGLQGTMTVGFVSSLGRVLPNNSNNVGPSYSIPGIIQTDASINPGNSGGALLDDSGKLMGVTYSIDTSSGSSSGVGFAIPSSIVQQVVPALIKTGHYDHPWLGVSIASMDPDLAAAMNLPASQKGALVETLMPGSPADKAGLQASQTQATISGQSVNVGGDIITAYNGQAIKTSDDIITDLAMSGVVGQTITLTVLRAGKTMDVHVALEARPAS
jgi:S1-C subfamily serine protease